MDNFNDTWLGKILGGALIILAVYVLIMAIMFFIKEFGWWLLLVIPGGFICYKIGDFLNKH